MRDAPTVPAGAMRPAAVRGGLLRAAGSIAALPRPERVLASVLAGWIVAVPLASLAWVLAGTDPAQDRGASEAAAVAKPSLDAIDSRPLFSRSRRPEIQPQPLPPPPVAVPMLDRQIALRGVVFDGQIRRAFVTTPSRAEGLWIAPGGEVGGWTVAAISHDGVSLAAGNERMSVLLRADAPPF